MISGTQMKKKGYNLFVMLDSLLIRCTAVDLIFYLSFLHTFLLKSQTKFCSEYDLFLPISEHLTWLYNCIVRLHAVCCNNWERYLSTGESLYIKLYWKLLYCVYLMYIFLFTVYNKGLLPLICLQ